VSRFTILKKVAAEMLERAGRNNITIVSAGVAFYVFLGMVPLLAATVLTYGLIADPEMVSRHVGAASQVLPPPAAELFSEQLESVVETSDGKKGWGLVIALALALFGARNGAGSVLTALNIAHGVPEARPILKANGVALLITAGGVMAMICAVAAMASLSALGAYLPVGTAIVGTLVAYGLASALGFAGSAILYRFAPNRAPPRWKKVIPGAMLASGGWLILTLGFGTYVANFGNYNATYGSLAAVAILLTWLYFSALVLLMGAELNAAWGDRRAGYEGLEVG
jgi:membrane protein